jgi:hypothetical protein
MINIPKDGGPAFPRPASEAYPKYGQQDGMTLRDWFAGQALAGILINYTTQKFGVKDSDVAQHAYIFADAMLAERAKGQP